MGFTDIHLLDDDEIVVHGNDDVDKPDRDEQVEPFLYCCDKDIQFPDETGQRGHPGQRQEKNQHRKGEKG